MGLFEKQRSSKPKGYVIILFAMALLVFLSLAGVAIDLSNIYAWQMRLERSAKAAAFSTIQFRALRGWSDFFDTSCQTNSTINPQLLTHARSVLVANLRSFYSGSQADADYADTSILSTNGSSYSCQNDRLTLSTTYKVRTFLLGSILGLTGRGTIVDANGRFVVNSSATAQLDPVAVTLVLDVSGSMACTDPTCACRTNNTCSTSGRQVIQDLADAVSGFRSYFNPFHDYIGVVTFNLGARTEFALAAPPFGSTQNRLNNFINVTSVASPTNTAGFSPRSNTNICDGLRRAISEMSSFRTALPNVQKVVVLFTDGAPNAFVGDFDVNPPPAPVPAPADGTYYQYALEWRDSTTTPATVYRGPSPLVQPPGGTLWGHAIQSNNIGPTNSTYCGPTAVSQISSPNNFPGVLNKAVNANACLNALDFSIPGTNVRARVTGVTIDQNGGDDTKFNYARLGYFCAIEAADFIRTEFEAPVFTVGVGPSGTANCTDPFENVDNPIVRKDSFLARVALDPEVVTELTGPDSDTSRFNFQQSRSSRLPACNCSGTTCDPATTTNVGYTPGIGPNLTNADLQGEYFGTSSGDQLGLLFSTVAKQILLRLGN